MNFKKVLASALAISTIMGTISTGVLANDTEITSLNTGNSVLRYSYISSVRPTLSSSGNIKVVVSLQKNLDFSVALDLEQYVGGSWESIDSWSLDGTSGGIISESCSLESGERYRACAYVEVYDEYGDLVESTTKYSSAVTAR